MRRNLIAAVLTSLLAVWPASAQYQKIKPNFSVEGWYASITNGDRDGASMIDLDKNKYPAFNFLVGWQTKPGCKNEEIASTLNYPVYGIGLGYEKFSSIGSNYEDSRLGDLFNIYGFFEGSFYKNDWFSVGLTLRLGLGITFDIYNIETNPNNVHFGAPTSLYVCGGPQVKFRPTEQLEIGANAFIWHHSNGHTWTPNTGINQRGVGVSARYSLEKPYTGKHTKVDKSKAFTKGFVWDIFAHNGMHAYKAEWFASNALVRDYDEKKTDFTSWQRLGLGASCQYRYCLLCSTGIEVDATYMWGLSSLEKADRTLYGDKAVDESPGYCPLMVTTGLVHEFYYGNCSAYIGLGYYALHKVGIYEDTTRLYEKIGMRFYVPSWNNVFIGWNMLARNFTEADHFELQLGIRI